MEPVNPITKEEHTRHGRLGCSRGGFMAFKRLHWNYITMSVWRLEVGILPSNNEGRNIYVTALVP